MFEKFHYYWHKLAIGLLALHSIQGLYESVVFLFIEYPELEETLEAHLLTTHEVNTIITPAIILMISTVISILMALRLNGAEDDAGLTFDLLLATAVIAINFFFLDKLVELELFQHFSQSLY